MFLGVGCYHSCIILGTHVLFTFSRTRLDALLIRTGKSRVVYCYSRDIGMECLPHNAKYKDDGRGHGLLLWMRPRRCIANMLRSKCVVALLNV